MICIMISRLVNKNVARDRERVHSRNGIILQPNTLNIKH